MTDMTDMTDEEKFELAAKAAGWIGGRSKHGYWNITSPEGKTSSHFTNWATYDSYTGEKLAEPTFADALIEAGWNPRDDDGDALRLAVKLNANVLIDFDRPTNAVVVGVNGIEDGVCVKERGDDHCAATRLAIFNAAVKIGKAMK